MEVLLLTKPRGLEAFIDAAYNCLHGAILSDDIVPRLCIVHLLVRFLSEACLVLQVHVARREELRRLTIVDAGCPERLL